MTLREKQRLAAAVRRVQLLAPGHEGGISVEIGRAALGEGASVEAWEKWLASTGWPKELVKRMAEREAGR